MLRNSPFDARGAPAIDRGCDALRIARIARIAAVAWIARIAVLKTTSMGAAPDSGPGAVLDLGGEGRYRELSRADPRPRRSRQI